MDAGDMGLLCEVLNVPITYFYLEDDAEAPDLFVSFGDELRHVYVQVKHMEERLAGVMARSAKAGLIESNAGAAGLIGGGKVDLLTDGEQPGGLTFVEVKRGKVGEK